jgi:hypothetical protein
MANNDQRCLTWLSISSSSHHLIELIFWLGNTKEDRHVQYVCIYKKMYINMYLSVIQAL